MGIVEVKLIREIIWILGLDVQLEDRRSDGSSEEDRNTEDSEICKEE